MLRAAQYPWSGIPALVGVKGMDCPENNENGPACAPASIVSSLLAHNSLRDNHSGPQNHRNSLFHSTASEFQKFAHIISTSKNRCKGNSKVFDHRKAYHRVHRIHFRACRNFTILLSLVRGDVLTGGNSKTGNVRVFAESSPQNRFGHQKLAECLSSGKQGSDRDRHKLRKVRLENRSIVFHQVFW